ncbi:MAG: lipopolysaccharide assembly protein LapA domain-containing protein [Pseudohongiellaceae bacterium]|jgi:uncharacterized integral membrane protein
MNLKMTGALFALALVAIFVLQNMEIVSVEFLIWQIQASRVIIYLSIFLIGLLVGWLTRSLRKR